MTKYLTRTCTVILVFLVSASVLLAGLTSIDVSPFPIVVGRVVTYSALSTPPPPFPSFYDWDYRCTEGSVGNWNPSPPDRTYTNMITYQESRVGSYDLRCKLTYGDLTTSTLTRGLTILGPDTDVILSGLNVNSTGYPQMTLTVTFEVRRGSTAIGMYTSGYPQERIRRPQFGFDSGWQGGWPDYYFNPNKNIIDVKSVTRVDNSWDNLAVGAIFDDFYQQNRAVIPNCHGVNTYFYFSDVHYQKQKTGAQTWKLIIVP